MQNIFAALVVCLCFGSPLAYRHVVNDVDIEVDEDGGFEGDLAPEGDISLLEEETSKTTSGPGRGALVMIDAGSSGSKVFIVPRDGTNPHSMKVKSQCTAEAGDWDNLGAAAMAYDVADCKPMVYVADNEWNGWAPLLGPSEEGCTAVLKTCNSGHQFGTQSLTISGKSPLWIESQNRPYYATQLLRYVERMAEHGSMCEKVKGKQRASCPEASNTAKVPMLATAGMRLLTPELNDVVWGSICGMQWNRYKFAERGPNCGTIPGTSEAFYEFLAANAGATKETLTTTLTVGGASAQIALPFLSGDEENLAAFKDMMRKVRTLLGDCSAVMLPSGGPIPIFSGGVPCYRDFVDLREIKLPNAGACKTKSCKSGVVTVGLISFLGLEQVTGGIGMAGGTDAIERWAAKNGCGAAAKGAGPDEEYNFAQCEIKLEAALAEDQLWVAVKAFFKATGWGSTQKKHMTFGTNAAIPANRFSDKAGHPNQTFHQLLTTYQDGGDATTRVVGPLLKKVVQTRCTTAGEMNKRFGMFDSQTCMIGLYAGIWAETYLAPGPQAKLKAMARLVAQGVWRDRARARAEAAEKDAIASLALTVDTVMDTRDAAWEEENTIFFETVDWANGKFEALAMGDAGEGAQISLEAEGQPHRSKKKEW